MEGSSLYSFDKMPRQDSAYSSQSLADKDPKKIGGIFESMFYKTLLQEMRKGSFGDALGESFEREQFQGMQDDQLAYNLGMQEKLGLSKLIQKQIALAKNNSVSPEQFKNASSTHQIKKETVHGR